MRSSTRLIRACLPIFLVWSASASAQVPLERFSAVRFAPAPGAGNYLSTEGVSAVTSHLVPSGGLSIDWAHRPFELRDVSCTDPSETNCSVEGDSIKLVNYTIQFNLHGAITLIKRIQIGLNLPLVLSGGDSFNHLVQGQMVSIVGGTAFAVGDPVLSVKGRIWNNENLYLGATVYGAFPVAHQIQGDAFLGDESVRVGGHVIAQFLHSGFHVAANVGGFWRPERTLFSTTVGSQFTYKVAAGYDITPLIMVYGELDGAASFSSELDENPLEVRAGARIRQGDFVFGGAVGAGLIAGVGVPMVRVVGNFAYAPMRSDTDGDGVEDATDACPSEAEDLDDWEDEDGCPEADNDADGMLDGDDPCPNEAEDMDGFEDEDGCPDADNDGDGVRDGFDTCPNDPEDMDGDRDEDGCPDEDTDRDGIPDAADQCPEEPEDADGFGDEDGCPEDDFDEDGIPDDGDECPDQPEILNQIADEDGCPEEDGDGDGIIDDVDRCPANVESYNGNADDDGCPDGAPLYSVEAGGILNSAEPIRFRSRGAAYRSRSRLLLQVLANVLNRYPALHAKIITSARTQELAQQRADAVKEALIEHGVHGVRLTIEATEGEDEAIARVITSIPAGHHAASSANEAPPADEPAAASE